MKYAGYCPCCGAELEVENWCNYCGSVQNQECILSLSPPALPDRGRC